MQNIIKNIIEQELQQKNVFYPFVSDISKREKDILELRRQLKTLEEIGEKFNLTRERVRQIENKAKVKIHFQENVIQKLAQKISEAVFTEDEIERAFFNYIQEEPPINPNSTAGIDYSMMKLDWLGLNKHLWELKGRTKDN